MTATKKVPAKKKAAVESPRQKLIRNVKTTIRGLQGKLPMPPAEEVAKWIKNGAVLVDVRSKLEVKQNPVPGAVNIPLLKLGDELSTLPRNKTFVTFCLRGGRAQGDQRRWLQERSQDPREQSLMLHKSSRRIAPVSAARRSG
jgi:rhodanese-related sulfurtransferase